MLRFSVFYVETSRPEHQINIQHESRVLVNLKIEINISQTHLMTISLSC